jgi:hypothetical protein
MVRKTRASENRLFPRREKNRVAKETSAQRIVKMRYNRERKPLKRTFTIWYALADTNDDALLQGATNALYLSRCRFLGKSQGKIDGQPKSRNPSIVVSEFDYEFTRITATIQDWIDEHDIFTSLSLQAARDDPGIA